MIQSPRIFATLLRGPSLALLPRIKSDRSAPAAMLCVVCSTSFCIYKLLHRNGGLAISALSGAYGEELGGADCKSEVLEIFLLCSVQGLKHSKSREQESADVATKTEERAVVLSCSPALHSHSISA
jgi:hypothetical protein